MQIQVDTREHKQEWARIESQFIGLGVDYFRSKLYVGDYMSLDNPRLVVDRKKDLLELCGNVCQQHERFKKELVRAQEHNIQIVILCEHGADIQSLSDVYFWHNPRIDQWMKKLRYEHFQYRGLSDEDLIKQLRDDGVDKRKLIPPTEGKNLYKSLNTMQQKYGVQFEFCTKDKTGSEILKILGG